MEGTVNIGGIIVAAISAFIIGGFWYSPVLLGSVWMETADLDEETLRETDMKKIFSLAFLFLLVMAFCLERLLYDPSIDFGRGAFYGFLAGFGVVFFAFAVNSLYERRSWKYTLVNGGYWAVALTVMGLILGAL